MGPTGASIAGLQFTKSAYDASGNSFREYAVRLDNDEFLSTRIRVYNGLTPKT